VAKGSGDTTVIQYVLGRLKELGVTDVFGIPGDFAYPLCDAICDDPEIKWIGCANEVNASYAADGYARRKGVGALVSTYGAGEAYLFGGLAGAHSDSLKVVSMTGAAGWFERDGRKLHHQISDQPPNYDLFPEMVKALTAGGDGVAVITPDNCVYETERLIAAMLYHSKPINLAFPRDVPHQPVVMPEGELDIRLANPQSNADALDAVVREIVHRVSNAKRACIVPGLAIRRHGAEAEALALIEASGLPFFVGFSDMGVLPQSHPQYGGVYAGGWVGLAQPEITEFVESCDCLLGLGPVNHEFNNAFHTMKYDFKSTINVMPHQTRIGMATYENVEMKDVLAALAKAITKSENAPKPAVKPSYYGKPTGAESDTITYTPLYERVQAFTRPDDVLVADTALASFMAYGRMQFPSGGVLEGQSAWGAIGWGTGAMLGMCAADATRRCVIIAGEGGHQMTACELGTYYRYGLKPVFLLVNNRGYLGERATNRYPDEEYNDVTDWNFADLPAAMGCKDWYTAKVTTLGELDAALAEAEQANSGVYIEIMVDPYAMPDGGHFLFTGTGALFGMPDRTWDGWLKEMETRKK